MVTCLYGSVIIFMDLREIQSIQGYGVQSFVSGIDLVHNNNEVGDLRPSPARIAGE